MNKNSNKRLLVLRGVGISLMLATAYIAWYTMRSGTPRDFWKDKMNPQRTDITKLPGNFEDQDGKTVTLKDFADKQIIATFVFKDCGMSCPLIMKDLKYFDSENPNFQKNGVFLIFTFEDHRGHSAQLQDFLKKYGIVGNHWRVLTSDAKTIRNMADSFDLQYNKGEKGNYVYMHSNYYLVAEKGGKVKLEMRGIENDKKLFINKIRRAL